MKIPPKKFEAMKPPKKNIAHLFNQKQNARNAPTSMLENPHLKLRERGSYWSFRLGSWAISESSLAKFLVIGVSAPSHVADSNIINL